MNAPSRRTNTKRRGFTLVEVLLAVTILSLVMTAVYNIWSAALMAWRRGGDASEVFQRQRIVMDTLTELSQSVVYYGASPGLYAVTGTSKPDWGDTVSFVTASDVLLPPSEAIDAGMRRVTISMLQAHVLSMDVSGFYVRYLDPRNNTWGDKWEETNIIPLAMEFTVVFGQQGDRLPPVVVTRAIDLPVATFIAESGGMPVPQGSAGEVERQDVDSLAESRKNSTSQSPWSSGMPGVPLPGRKR